MSSPQHLAAAVLDLVAPSNWREMNIRRADLRLEAGEPLTLALECVVIHGPEKGPDIATRMYVLREEVRHQESSAEAASAATRRIKRLIERSAAEHSAQICRRVIDLHRETHESHCAWSREVEDGRNRYEAELFSAWVRRKGWRHHSGGCVSLSTLWSAAR
jgi:hypothetical protein